ncbi:50S ribosomal protein L18 [bacterium]|nr:50S ribosomal protein L18 [bacterium]
MGMEKNRRAMMMLRHKRLRRHVSGTAERPRLAVFRSNRYIYVQLIDDVAGKTVAAANSLQDALKKEAEGKKQLEVAALVGKAIAAKAKEAGITTVVFDRGGSRYHGCVKALADAAREAGLEF